MKHITIRDIAKKLNLAISTVSRALNDKYDIKKETRDLVLKTAKDMGYSPNPIAKNLLKQCTKQIGVVVPEFINSFFPEVIIGIQEVIMKKGYQVLIMQSGESCITELENVKALECNMVDGNEKCGILQKYDQSWFSTCTLQPSFQRAGNSQSAD
jgi:LacI family transcriptional regulator